MNNSPSSKELYYSDPLSDVTRRERRNLILFSFLILLIKGYGISKLDISGIKIDFQDEDAVYADTILGTIVCYFFMAFIIYAYSDVMKWLIKILGVVKQEEEKAKQGKSIEEMVMVKISDIKNQSWYRKIWGLGLIYERKYGAIRTVFDFALPIGGGIAAIWFLYEK